MQSTQEDDRRCFIDGGDGSEGCVLDENDLSGCDIASTLHADGLCKVDCPHWRYPEAVAESRKSDAQRVKARILIRRDAAALREEKLQRDVQFHLELAATAPEPQEEIAGGGTRQHETKNKRDTEQFTH